MLPGERIACVMRDHALTTNRGFVLMVNATTRKNYQHPKPIRPSDLYLFLIILLAGAVIAETDGFWERASAIGAVGWAFSEWVQNWREFRMAELEWKLANSQDWLKHFEQRQDPEGILNWSKQVQRLEDKLNYLKTHRWKLEAPDSAEEKLEKQKAEAITKAQKQRVKAFRVGDHIRFKEGALDGRQIGTIVSVAKDGSSFQVKWDLYTDVSFMSSEDVEEVELAR